MENEKAALTQASRDGLNRLVKATAKGGIRNTDGAKGVVESSVNVGVVNRTDDNGQIHCRIRSVID
ncbi:cytosol nonspecific dipeptidase, partial [Klebsiella quasipneumoniae subsp. similipneumoniae]